MNDVNDKLMKSVWPVGFESRHVKGAFGRRLCGYTISLEAWRRGLEVTIDSTRANAFQHFSISSNEKKIKFNRSRVMFTTASALNITKDKEATRKCLQNAGLPTPVGIKINRTEGISKALEFVADHGYPVVLKRVVGSQGKGVYSGIKDEVELLYYFTQLVNNFDEVEFIIEKHFTGDDYRIYASRERMIAAVKRVPANIIGDGVSSIRKLIASKNKIRSQNPFLSKGLIKIDSEVSRFVENAGYTLDSIIQRDELLYLRDKANASAGGDVIDVTDDIPESISNSAVLVVRSIPGLECCGVDILYNSESGDFTTIEINARAQVGVNMYPSVGIGRNVPGSIIDTYFPEAPLDGSKVNPNIIFDVEEALSSLISGVNSSVTLSPVKNYKSFSRKYVRLSACDYVNKDLAKKFSKLASEYDVIGNVQVLPSCDVKIYCAGDGELLTSFVKAVKDFLSPKEVLEKKWLGPVKNSFVVYFKEPA